MSVDVTTGPPALDPQRPGAGELSADRWPGGGGTPGTDPGHASPGDALSSTTADGSAGNRASAGTAGSRPDAAAYPHTPEFLLDVRLTVSVEVGRVQLPIRQVLDLGPGSVIELPRSASEPVEVFANGRCIGRGEIVVVGEHFGVRLTELGPA